MMDIAAQARIEKGLGGNMTTSRVVCLMAAAVSLGWAAPAMADLERGYAAWDNGDYSTAVREWRDLSAKGNPDAQFNMAQAYRLGRGVDENAAQAEILMAKAAAQGHIRAIDTYGLLLFQSGRREEAMPYVIDSAERGNPRAQYLLGIGHFNGDLVGKDWVRGYALMTLSNAAGFEPAKTGIAQMDDFIPLEQRQEAQLVAQKLKRNADSKLSAQLAANDLAVGAQLTGATPSTPVTKPVTAPLPSSANRIPQPIRRTNVPPSIAAAQTAIAEATRVTGTESPANAGADSAGSARTEAAPVRTAAAPRATAPKPAAAAPRGPATSASGPWRVQLGAFGVRSNADRLWSRVSGNSALAGKDKFVVPAGRIVKLQVGGFSSRGSAQSACNSLKRSGQECLVTK